MPSRINLLLVSYMSGGVAIGVAYFLPRKPLIVLPTSRKLEMFCGRSDMVVGGW